MSFSVMTHIPMYKDFMGIRNSNLYLYPSIPVFGYSQCYLYSCHSLITRWLEYIYTSKDQPYEKCEKSTNGSFKGMGAQGC